VPPQEVPNPQLPILQRLRVRYAKRGRLRFTSHRDFGRAFERAVRRAGVPIAFSSGFSPHPRISYAGAASTGSASEAEYLEIALTHRCDPDVVRADLDAALPDGLDVVDVVEVDGGSLADQLEASLWTVQLPGVEPGVAQAAVDQFLAAQVVEVERMTKRGLRRFDTRAAVVSLRCETGDAQNRQEYDRPCAILHMVVRHGTPSVRPDDVLAGLREVAGLSTPLPPLQQRKSQGPLDLVTGTVGDPFAPDRDTSMQ
jgi:radical SAM-linked protein